MVSAMDIAQSLISDVGIGLGSGDIGVSQHRLDGADVSAIS